MSKKGLLINDIELGYAPMSAFEFRTLITENKFPSYVSDSHLYAIAQRNALTFNNFNFDDELTLAFEIKQDGNENSVKCRLPIIQDNITRDKSKPIVLRLHNRNNTVNTKNVYPYNETQSFSIMEADENGNNQQLLVWFSPDKLLQNFWTEQIKVEILGDFHKMLLFSVHYVGKSTEQNICQRLSNHSTFQEILINQKPFFFKNIPSNEIMILLFRVQGTNTLTNWDDDTSHSDLMDFIQNYKSPNSISISLDMEKTLISNLKPEYNRVMYSSFPKKNDLVNSDYHERIIYGFTDPITLVYNSGIISGNQSLINRDYLVVDR